MKPLRSRLFSALFSRRGATAITAVLIALFLFRPGLYHLRNRIAWSIGGAMGRRVAINNVHLRFLPRPGFDLEGLVIYDDPAFSAEPMIRAEEVSAAIRIRSLLRGRLEIANLSATEPSINLVRNDQGQWNLASLLERNAQIPAAPTEKPASERRPAFPYLEAVRARVNFKIGQTKKSYALTNADVALWQDSENSWGARIKAEPVRTDVNLSDTGLLQINAAWQRAPSFRSTPVKVQMQWRNGQLGQITKLLSGRDRGWRGGVNLLADLSGTPDELRIESRAAIDDFRRYDIVDTESVRLAIACTGDYILSTSVLSGLVCEAPVGSGSVRLRGTSKLADPKPTYDLTLEANKVPVTSVVRLLRQAKKQVPVDLAASGILNAEFRATRDAVANGHGTSQTVSEKWTGSGSATDVRLSLKAENGNAGNGRDEVVFAAIPLVLVGGDSRGSNGHLSGKNGLEPDEPHLRIGSAALTMNSSPSVSAGGWLSASGYRLFLRGDAQLGDVFRLANIFGLPVQHPTAQGSSKLDVSISGAWQGFAVPAILGNAQLRNVRAEVRGLNTPIEIDSAAMTLAPDTVSMQKISARTGGTHWTGGVIAPRHCAASGTATNYAFKFDLAVDQFSTADLAAWFTPHPAKRPWYRLLDSNSVSNDASVPSPLLALQAHGNLHIGQFDLKNVIASQVVSRVEIDRGKITLNSLRAQILQGSHQGNWTILVPNHDVSGHAASSHDASVHEAWGGIASASSVRYHGEGTLHDISLARVGTLMNDDWITGTADANFDLDGVADSFRGLLTRSDGKLQFVMRNGSLTHIEIPGSPAPLPVHRFTGELRLKQGVWNLSGGSLESHDGLYQVSGSASAASGFDFTLTRGDDQSWTLTGTLPEPHITATSRTVAKRIDASANTKAVGVKP